MRIVFIIFIGLIAIVGYGQNQPAITITLVEVPAKEAIDQIAAQSQWNIYYDPLWMDSVSVSGNYVAQALGEVLNDLMQPLGINSYLEDGEVILTKGVEIISQPIFTQSYIQEDSAPSGFQGGKGLLFSRDYANESEALALQDQTIEIGERSAFVNGGNSTIVGYVRAPETGEGISETLIYLEDYSRSTSSDENGFYAISLPNGRSQLFFQNVGRKSTQRQLLLFSDGQLNVEMAVDVFTLSEVTISSDRLSNVEDVAMGVQKLNVQETKNVPVVLGERDIMKVATTLAGVQTLGEGSAGYNVRGGKSDQNLILLNNVPVYNTNHFLGFFSAFNSDAVEDMEIYKSSIPARLGGRLASVFDIQSLSANKEKFIGGGGVSPITAKLIVEIPIVKEKSALMIAGRTSYSNWILKRIENVNFRENRVSFSDLVFRYDDQLSKKDELIITGYFSRDDFNLKSDTLFSFSEFNYKNSSASAQWKHRFSEKLRSSVQAYWTSYNYDLDNVDSPPNAFEQNFSIADVGLILDVNYFINDDQKMAVGAGSKLYSINPGQKKPLGNESEVIPVNLQSKKGLESFAYLDYELAFNEKLRMAAGLRYSMFNATGEFDSFDYVEGLPINKFTRKNDLSFSGFRQMYHGPEYRFSLRYILDDQTSIKLALNRNRQYLHTLSNSSSLSPTDTWTISDILIKPQISDQVSLGYFKNLKNNIFEFSAEVYYKRIQNLLDFKIGADFLLNDQLAEVTLQGPGKSYGIELSLRKSGKLNGWINYTFARTFIQLDGDFAEETINQGDFFPTNYDKPHTINLVANYKLTRRISFSYNLNYSSGRPVTYPIGLYEFKGAQTVHYGDRNTFRIPDYFRMDLGISLEEGHRIKKLTHAYWTLSIYNLLGRDNPYSVFFDVRDGEVEGYQLIIFGQPIPTLSFNFRF